MRWCKKIFVVGAIVMWASAAFGGELVPVGLHKQLLVDDYVIAEKLNIVRELGKTQKKGVVLEAILPTDFPPTKEFPDGLPKEGHNALGYRTAIFWNEPDQKYQMFYRASAENVTGYAESKDGINWTKPLISDNGKSNLITTTEKLREHSTRPLS